MSETTIDRRAKQAKIDYNPWPMANRELDAFLFLVAGFFELWFNAQELGPRSWRAKLQSPTRILTVSRETGGLPLPLLPTLRRSLGQPLVLGPQS